MAPVLNGTAHRSQPKDEKREDKDDRKIRKKDCS